MDNSPNQCTPHVEPVFNDAIAPTQFWQTATLLVANGYSPIPITPGTKKPDVRAWSGHGQRAPAAKSVRKWIEHFPNSGVGLVGGRCVAVDSDIMDADAAHQFEKLARNMLGDDPLKVGGANPKFKLIYRATTAICTTHHPGFDILAERSQFLIFGIHPKTGLPYSWEGDSPLDRPLASLPEVTSRAVDAFRLAAIKLLGARIASAPTPANALPASMPHQGLIMDGRDKLLTKCVWSPWAMGENDPDKIADIAFADFLKKAEMSRPKKDGKQPWARADALVKANYLLNSGKVRPTMLLGFSAETDANDRHRFQRAIHCVAAHGFLPPAAVKVSHCMVAFANGMDGCFASPEYIAAKVSLAPDTVKRARRRLCELGIWRIESRGGGRGHRAHYFPEIDTALKIAEKVTGMGIRTSTEVRDYLSEEPTPSPEKKIEKEYKKVIESLILRSEEPGNE